MREEMNYEWKLRYYANALTTMSASDRAKVEQAFLTETFGELTVSEDDVISPRAKQLIREHEIRLYRDEEASIGCI